MKDNYDTYDAISLHDDDNTGETHSGEDDTSAPVPPALNKRVVAELIICILAFVGRVSLVM